MRLRLTLLMLWFAGAVAAVLSLLWGLAAALGGSRRAVRVAVAHDQALNAGWGGSEDETISSRAGKGVRRGVWHWCLLCRVLDKLDPGHCERSIEPDNGGALPNK